MSWIGSMMTGEDPIAPTFYEDKSILDNMPEHMDTGFRDIIDRIDYEDARTDHSVITPDEKNEITLFHSLKQDPYFKHYLYNHLRS